MLFLLLLVFLIAAGPAGVFVIQSNPVRARLVFVAGIVLLVLVGWATGTLLAQPDPFFGEDSTASIWDNAGDNQPFLVAAGIAALVIALMLAAGALRPEGTLTRRIGMAGVMLLTPLGVVVSGLLLLAGSH